MILKIFVTVVYTTAKIPYNIHLPISELHKNYIFILGLLNDNFCTEDDMPNDRMISQ
jgi:hypothetical protein